MSTDTLPRGWSRRVRSFVLHAISLATTALTVARAKAWTGGLRADLERAEQEIALLREELDLKDSRWIRLSPRRRPHYTPVQRMRILQLKVARHWSCEQAAAALMLDEQTLKSWLRRVDETGNVPSSSLPSRSIASRTLFAIWCASSNPSARRWERSGLRRRSHGRAYISAPRP